LISNEEEAQGKHKVKAGTGSLEMAVAPYLGHSFSKLDSTQAEAISLRSTSRLSRIPLSTKGLKKVYLEHGLTPRTISG
jgi:hypothetical protein